jgi:hypothetical protein
LQYFKKIASSYSNVLLLTLKGLEIFLQNQTQPSVTKTRKEIEERCWEEEMLLQEGDCTCVQQEEGKRRTKTMRMLS